MIPPQHKVRLRLLGFPAEVIAFMEKRYERWTEWEETCSMWESLRPADVANQVKFHTEQAEENLYVWPRVRDDD